ncbi:hypothetical protein ACJA23_01040 [Mycoplasma corogypsi]|uniref:hypothetical protein n=1 Tax=Mycoplasma corogypsi TaxID=2106 RepID=UPI003873A829
MKKWFSEKTNLEILVNKLTSLLGSENINNVELSSPKFTYKHVYFNKKQKNDQPETHTVYSTPVVTFNVSAKNGFRLLNTTDGNKDKLSINLSVLHKTGESDNEKPYLYTSVYFSTITGKPVTEDVIKKSNEYLNDIIEYNGPAIPLDASVLNNKLGKSGITVSDKTVNGTTNISEEEFNNKFRDWLIKEGQDSPINNKQFRSVLRNYIQTYDDRYDLNNTNKSGQSGIFLAHPILNTPGEKNKPETAKPAEGYNLKLNQFAGIRTEFKLQQIEGDTNAVYVPLQAKTSAGWLRIFLVRIPLTKFIAPISPMV